MYCLSSPRMMAMGFGERILKICKAKGIPLSCLAKDTGIPKATIHGWTTGRIPTNPEQLKTIANYLRVSFYELLFGESDPYESGEEEVLKELFHGDLRVTIHKVQRMKKNKKM